MYIHSEKHRSRTGCLSYRSIPEEQGDVCGAARQGGMPLSFCPSKPPFFRRDSSTHGLGRKEDAWKVEYESNDGWQSTVDG